MSQENNGGITTDVDLGSSFPEQANFLETGIVQDTLRAVEEEHANALKERIEKYGGGRRRDPGAYGSALATLG